MGHSLIVGMTESGKTCMGKALLHKYKREGVNTILLDPMMDPGWGADYVTRDPNDLLRVAKESRQCAIFIDEPASAIRKYDTEMEWLTTQSRHWGHETTICTQRGVQLSPTIREQCQKLYLFALGSERDAKVFADSYGDPGLLEACRLRQGEFLFARRFTKGERVKASRYRIDFPTLQVRPSA